MTDVAGVVVVGAGQAGGDLAAALRSAGYEGSVTLVGAEPVHPYTRPALSKGYLRGSTGVEELLLRDEAMYERHAIELRLGVEAVAIDRKRKLVMLSDGASLPYASLVLATGGRARRLELPGLHAAPNVLTLRTLADVDRLRARFAPGARMAIVGAGYVGLEVAAVARRRGLEVTVLEAAPRVLARVAVPPVSAFFERLHTEEGVDLRLGAAVAGCRRNTIGEVEALELADGSEVACDLVLIGIGLVPSTELAQGAGLAVDDGIVVDEHLRTVDPDVYAIGDVARHPDPEHGDLRRLESVPNAGEQARALAATLVGRPAPYAAVPWFWSDQYDVKLQLVGLPAAEDEIVVRGDLASGRSFAVFSLREGRVVAAAVANSPRDFAAARRLVAERVPVDTARLADPSVPARELLVSRTAA